VRADLPASIAAALDRCARPSLVFDLARIDANMRALAEAARAARITALFAAKSFPRPEVRAIAARRLAGFDVASAAELAEVAAIAARGPVELISIADPTGRAGAALPEAAARRVIVGCETAAQVRAAPARAEIAIRLSASLTGRDPAVGAVQDGSGHRRSRFGLDLDLAAGRRRALAELAELATAAAGRPVGLHVHHGAVAATGAERFIATARAALEAAAEAGVAPRFLDVGGAWHAVADLPRALRELRDALPADLELIVEPGRALADGAGFACGRVTAARELEDRPLRVVDLSRLCHLRWSHVELVGRSPQHAARPTLFVGPTCFEDDSLGEWTVEPPPPGARIAVRNVSGYAVAWNTGFGGVSPADVVLIDAG
jgi:2-[(L-alanin-3-ylcarbamoyl)methyl]-2-hydroxybutanedioate decarboxylase